MRELPPPLAALGAYRQFIICKYVPNGPKLDKFPCDFRTGAVVSAHDAQYWTDAPTAIAAAARWGSGYGVGFVFTEADPFYFLDLDSCAVPGGWSPIAQWCCQVLTGAAVERSVSGKGLHVFGQYRGAAPVHRSKNAEVGLELYHTGRFVALTGDGAIGDARTDCTEALAAVIAAYFAPGAEGVPQEWTTGPAEGWRGPSEDTEIIRRARMSQSPAAAFGGRASFNDLWLNNIDPLSRAYPAADGRAYDASSADAALAQHLAFWTGKDCERIQRIMWLSKLVRDKWTREDYLPRTIVAAVGRQMDILTDREPEPLAGTAALAVVLSPPAQPSMVQGATFLSCEAQRNLFSGCTYVRDVHRVLVPGGVLLKPDQFKVNYGGYTFAMDTVNEKTTRDAWEAFSQSQGFRCPRADGRAFRPDLAPGVIIQRDAQSLVNTFWPAGVPRKPGDASRFFELLRKLLPNERDAQIMLCYMAACVQHQGVKFQWAPLIIGVEGNGKTLLTRCVAEAIGHRYVHWPKPSKLSGNFNAWMLNNILYAVEDIYTPNDKREVIEELKPMITGGDGLEIEAKGVDQISADICGNFMFNSNHKDAITKTRNDRRFCTLLCAQQDFADIARDGMGGTYFVEMYKWMRAEGYAIVSELLHTMPIPDELNPATSCQRAPDTSTTAMAIAASTGGVEQEIAEAVAQGIPGFCGGWISTILLERLLERIGAARRITHNKRREMLQGMGYVLHPALHDGRVNNPVMPDAGKPRLFILKSSPAMTLPNAAEVARAYETANNTAFPVAYQ